MQPRRARPEDAAAIADVHTLRSAVDEHVFGAERLFGIAVAEVRYRRAL